jgi:hypothetical protein
MRDFDLNKIIFVILNRTEWNKESIFFNNLGDSLFRSEWQVYAFLEWVLFSLTRAGYER